MHSVPVHRLSDPLMHFAVSIRFSDDQGVVDNAGIRRVVWVDVLVAVVEYCTVCSVCRLLGLSSSDICSMVYSSRSMVYCTLMFFDILLF